MFGLQKIEKGTKRFRFKWCAKIYYKRARARSDRVHFIVYPYSLAKLNYHVKRYGVSYLGRFSKETIERCTDLALDSRLEQIERDEIIKPDSKCSSYYSIHRSIEVFRIMAERISRSINYIKANKTN